MQRTSSRERPGAPPLRRLAHRLLVTTLSASFVLNGALPVRARSAPAVDPAPAAAVAPPPRTAPEAEASAPAEAAAVALPAALADTGSGETQLSGEIVATVDDLTRKRPRSPIRRRSPAVTPAR